MSSVATDTAIKVLSFNMQYGQGWDDADPDSAPVDLRLTVEALLAVDADVVFLQEVEAVAGEGRQIHPPPNYGFLRDALRGYQSCFAYPPADVGELPFGYGLAIFSRGPIRNQRQLVLPAPDISFQFEGRPCRPTARLALGAETELCGQPIQLWNTHLQAFFMIGGSADNHPAQRDTLVRAIGRCSAPTLLGGDFNCAPGDGTVAAIERATGLQPLENRHPTWRRRPYVLDHLFATPGLRPLRWEVLPTPASDHHMVVGTYEIRDSSRVSSAAVSRERR